MKETTVQIPSVTGGSLEFFYKTWRKKHKSHQPSFYNYMDAPASGFICVKIRPPGLFRLRFILYHMPGLPWLLPACRWDFP